MPFLYIEKGIDKGLAFPCDCITPIIIGRGATCTITLQDASTSRNHFKIFEKDGQYYIEDMASRNGTRVNEENIQQPTLLQDGDMITAGETTLCWSLEETQKSEPLIGTEINGYKIMKKLGRGGMGVVYLARQGFLEREVAFKIMMPKKNAVNNNQLIQSFLQETRTYATFNHPNIIQIYDAGQWEENFYFSMEYAPNGSLQDKVSGCKSLPWEEALPYMLDTALGLEYAEKKQIVHCDIKPDNLLISDDNHIKIVDLGIACRMNQLKTDTKVYGTPHFLSPEQAQGLSLDHRSDIYSFGATFYRVLSGQTPFSGASSTELLWKHVNSEPEPIKDLVPNLPDSIARMIQKMMQKNPEDRYKSNTDIIADIHKIKDRGKRITSISRPSTLKSSSRGSGKTSSLSNVNKVTMSMSRRELNARLKQKKAQQNKKNFIIFSIVLFIITVIAIIAMVVYNAVDNGFFKKIPEKKELTKQEKETLESLKKRYTIIAEHHRNNPENVEWLKKQYTMLLQQSFDPELNRKIETQLKQLESTQENNTLEQDSQKEEEKNIEEDSETEEDSEEEDNSETEEENSEDEENSETEEEDSEEENSETEEEDSEEEENSETEEENSETEEDSEEYEEEENNGIEKNDILKENNDVDNEEDISQQEDNFSIDPAIRSKYLQEWEKVKQQVDTYDATVQYYLALRAIRTFADSCPKNLERLFKDELEKRKMIMLRKSKDVITNYCHKINTAIQFKQKKTINQYLDRLQLYHKEPDLTKYVELKYSQLEPALKRVGIKVPVAINQSDSDSEVKTYYQKNIVDLYYKIRKEVKMSSTWQNMVLELSQNIKEFEKKYSTTKFYKDLKKQ